MRPERSPQRAPATPVRGGGGGVFLCNERNTRATLRPVTNLLTWAFMYHYVHNFAALKPTATREKVN
jgi:hypothetical protein